MEARPKPVGGPVRGAEIVATLCLATDLGMGLPFEHGLHRTIVAMRLADRLGADRATATDVHHAGLLAHAGCTADAHVTALVFRDSRTTHLNPVMFGSSREILAGLVAALPERDRGPPSVPCRSSGASRGWRASNGPT